MRPTTQHLVATFALLLLGSCSPVFAAKTLGGSSSSGGTSGSSGYGSGSSGYGSGSSSGSNRPSGESSNSGTFSSSGPGSGPSGGNNNHLYGGGSYYAPHYYGAGYGAGRHHRNKNIYRNNNIKCNSNFDCTLGELDDGVHVCRVHYSPTSGDPTGNAVCIGKQLALKEDGCGCCGDECIPALSFQELQCSTSTNSTTTGTTDTQRSGTQGGELSGDIPICRDLFDPFTGEEVSKTLFVPRNQGLERDVCGCCVGDEECDQEQLQGFARPSTTDVVCPGGGGEGTASMPCALPNDGGGVGGSSGVTVCRKFFDPLSGDTSNLTICTPPTHGWESDECGCCDDECPVSDPTDATTPLLPATPDCQQQQHSCQFKNGETGTHVCRSLFHPLDGQLRFRTLCVNETWISDTCGLCCDESNNQCSEIPENGYEDEAIQLLMLSMEDPKDLEVIDYTNFDSSGGWKTCYGLRWLVLATIGVLATFF